MLTIRLQRAGKKNRPDFRVILAESTSAAGKKFNEILGSYNPRTKLLQVKDRDRMDYWLKQNVKLSPTVHNLFVTNKLVELKKVKAYTTPKKAEVSTEAVQKPEPQAAVESNPQVEATSATE